jgi:hypothetical protein
MALRWRSFLILSGLLVQTGASALETLVRQPRQMAMGGIGVGLADDEYALFNNPAGLAGVRTRKFRAVGLTIEGSLDTYSSLSSVTSAMSSLGLSGLNELMGKDIYLRGSYAPLITLPGFAVSFIADAQGSLLIRNQANPSYRIGNMLTYGVQAGMGWSFKSGRRPVDEWRVGLSGKMLWRKGGLYDLGNPEFLQLANDPTGTLARLVGNYGLGIGADVGVQYVRHLDSKGSDFFFGASLTDIGNTRFDTASARPVPTNASVGLGWIKKSELLSFKAGLDVRNLTDNVRFSNKIHFGTETSLPLFDLYAGLNQLNLTYGAAFDLWVVRVTALSYAEELGVAFHQNTSRRYVLQVDFNLPI